MRPWRTSPGILALTNCEVLDAGGLKLKGITTDASSLYPVPVAEVFGPVAHQICEFHIIADLTKAVLKAVAKMRRTLKAQMPNLPRGRPATKAHKRIARRKKRLQKRIADLFDHRHLFSAVARGGAGRKASRITASRSGTRPDARSVHERQGPLRQRPMRRHVFEKGLLRGGRGFPLPHGNT